MGSLIKRTFSPHVTSLALRCIARQLSTLSHVAGATYHHSHKRGGKPPSALAKAAIPCSFGWIDGQLASEDTPFN
jgi:hypothetical protein